jgi:hypothetical protein
VSFNENSVIHGVSARLVFPSGLPPIVEFNALMDRSDASLGILRADGKIEAIIPLQLIPLLPMCGDDEYVFPLGLRAGDVAKWKVPPEVSVLRLSILGEGYYYLDMLAQKR